LLNRSGPGNPLLLPVLRSPAIPALPAEGAALAVLGAPGGFRLLRSANFKDGLTQLVLGRPARRPRCPDRATCVRHGPRRTLRSPRRAQSRRDALPGFGAAAPLVSQGQWKPHRLLTGG